MQATGRSSLHPPSSRRAISATGTISSVSLRSTSQTPSSYSRLTQHFCASIEVGESVLDPLKYYENNVSGTVTLLQAMQKYKTKYFVFSSTAALFGIPERIPIQAEDVTKPINPYGETKLAVENMLKWCDQAFGLKYVCLRYFNAYRLHSL